MPTQNPNGPNLQTIDPNGPDTAKDEVWEDMVNDPNPHDALTADLTAPEPVDPVEEAPKPKAKKGK